MSSLHWEARRRQAVLDRRSRSKQDKEDPPQPIPKEQSGPDKPTQPAGEERSCVHCKGKPGGSAHYGGPRVDSRYNSIQYAQQW
ncbi:hypothetical protein SKAU_G00208160 [Synaphobranchus kaupii]|uniref:Uncharacterized protein n=1 Tax=Synaphobranchus kaupii TaxID=118154 RepID=A0A9Q1F8D2_SYNKA|nr:hypothetical protein SKAU_G00208160 [Synaphobranchus kaupii]